MDKRVLTTRDLDFYAIERQLRDATLRTEGLARLHRYVFKDALSDRLIGDWAEIQLEPIADEVVEESLIGTLDRYEELAGGARPLVELIRDSGYTKEEFSDWLRRIIPARMMAAHWLQLQIDQIPPEQAEARVKDGVRVRLQQLTLDTRDYENPQETILQLQRDLSKGLTFSEAHRLYDPDGVINLGWLEVNTLSDSILEIIGNLRQRDVSESHQIGTTRIFYRIVDIDTQEEIDYRRSLEEEEEKALQEIISETDLRVTSDFRSDWIDKAKRQ